MVINTPISYDFGGKEVTYIGTLERMNDGSFKLISLKYEGVECIQDAPKDLVDSLGAGYTRYYRGIELHAMYMLILN